MMIFNKNSLLTVLISSLFLLSNPVTAKDYPYQGKVKGMVCAFCAYNVSNKIGQIDGVKANSVNVDLKSGEVSFLSTLPVKRSQIANLFADSGFSLMSLDLVVKSEFNALNFSEDPVVTLAFANTEIESLDSVLDAVGSLAAEKTSLLLVNAPKVSEIDLLKPILAGRQRVIKVQFSPTQGTAIDLKLYQAKTNEPIQ